MHLPLFDPSTRITSYNVCYTKLLRERHHRDGIGVVAPEAGEHVDVHDAVGLGEAAFAVGLHQRAEFGERLRRVAESYNFV